MNYVKHYCNLIERARNRNSLIGYSERHHILPRCLGGSDDESNLVTLTAREHFVAHQLLVKLHPEHVGISYAAMLMTRLGQGNGRVSNRYYDWLKSRYSKLQSIMMKEWLKEHGNPSEREDVKRKRREAWLGEKNPSFGNPNWKAIKAASEAIRGKPQNEEHSKKISDSIKKWHENNQDKHPMKNPETLAKAVASRRATYLKKKGLQ